MRTSSMLYSTWSQILLKFFHMAWRSILWAWIATRAKFFEAANVAASTERDTHCINWRIPRCSTKETWGAKTFEPQKVECNILSSLKEWSLLHDFCLNDWISLSSSKPYHKRCEFFKESNVTTEIKPKQIFRLFTWRLSKTHEKNRFVELTFRTDYDLDTKKFIVVAIDDNALAYISIFPTLLSRRKTHKTITIQVTPTRDSTPINK